MIPWDKLHGAMTHFPIALLLFSTACDFVSVEVSRERSDVAARTVPVFVLNVVSFGAVAAAGYFGGELLLSGGGVP
jgi:uncharacterized membrane protein